MVLGIERAGSVRGCAICSLSSEEDWGDEAARRAAVVGTRWVEGKVVSR
jgi:hypothetical protein